MLDEQRRWAFEPARGAGDEVTGGDILGQVMEREGFAHPILVPPDLSGTIAELHAGAFSVVEPIGRLADGTPLRLAQE